MSPDAISRDDGAETVFLGIDGGGTKTAVAIINAKAELVGSGSAGASNINVCGAAAATKSFQHAIAEAVTALPPGTRAGGVWAAVAGAGQPAQQRRVQRILRRVLRTQPLGNRSGLGQAPLRVTDDACAVLAASDLSEGIVVIVGTGSFVWGQRHDGVSARAGGWGYLLGDPGGGFDLGRRAVVAVLSESDGFGPSTALTPLLLDRFAIPRPLDLIPLVYAGAEGRAHLASLGEAVLSLAGQGDPVARGIVDHAASELAQQIIAVATSLHISDVSIVRSGSIARHPVMEDALHRSVSPFLRVHWQLPLRTPAEGAATLARTLAIAGETVIGA
ncbi:MAG: hypothetical protein M1296_05135 [Chloroflexi bacterium]|nr:hypothetical protein [Chloroflexota bacterium]